MSVKNLAISLLTLTVFQVCEHSFAAIPNPASQQNLSCKSGPITKQFGGSEWLVYDCSDGRTVVVASAPGSSAGPFYFTLSPEMGKVRSRGEGKGNKAVTDAAAKELQAMSPADLQQLFDEVIRRTSSQNNSN